MKKEILQATLVAGTLDIIAAFGQAYVLRRTPPDIILRYIASGLFGKIAFSGSYIYPLMGLIFHFIIVLACTAVYFRLYPKIRFLQKNIILSALLIALTAWVITTQVVVRLSKIGAGPVELHSALIAIAILFVCIGLPVSVFAKQYFNRQKSSGKVL